MLRSGSAAGAFPFPSQAPTVTPAVRWVQRPCTDSPSVRAHTAPMCLACSHRSTTYRILRPGRLSALAPPPYHNHTLSRRVTLTPASPFARTSTGCRSSALCPLGHTRSHHIHRGQPRSQGIGLATDTRRLWPPYRRDCAQRSEARVCWPSSRAVAATGHRWRVAGAVERDRRRPESKQMSAASPSRSFRHWLRVRELRAYGPIQNAEQGLAT